MKLCDSSGLSGLDRNDADGLATTPAAEQDVSTGKREQCVVTTATHQVPRVELGTALPDEDFTGVNELAAEALDAKSLSV